jgi:hypothetical protein
MSNTENVNVRTLAGLPASVQTFLNGKDLLSKTQALRLTTVDADGWTKAALITPGDILALPDGRFRFAIPVNSDTAANLIRDNRFTFSMAIDGGMYSIRLRARKCEQGTQEMPLAFFEAEVERIRMHTTPSADVVSGITFTLREPSAVAVIDRWQRQIAALQAAS